MICISTFKSVFVTQAMDESTPREEWLIQSILYEQQT